MSIGTKLLQLRTDMKLSQGELANMLDVSRQSVSKWETDTAIPDLDKLMKLCDVFGVTLDELTCRNSKQDNKSPSVIRIVENELPVKHQKIIGYILLTVSLISGIFIWVLAEHEEDLYITIPIIISVLVCSLICLFVKQKAGYWCIWAAAAPIVLLSPYVLGFNILKMTSILIITFTVIMTLIARKLFSEVKIITSRKKTLRIIFGWVAIIGIRVIDYIFIMHTIISSAGDYIPHIFINLISYIGTSLLLTYTVCYVKVCKKRA